MGIDGGRAAVVHRDIDKISGMVYNKNNEGTGKRPPPNLGQK